MLRAVTLHSLGGDWLIDSTESCTCTAAVTRARALCRFLKQDHCQIRPMTFSAPASMFIDSTVILYVYSITVCALSNLKDNSGAKCNKSNFISSINQNNYDIKSSPKSKKKRKVHFPNVFFSNYLCL